jgi:hypothetical protein
VLLRYSPSQREDIGPQLGLSFSASHSRRFTSAGDDDISLTVDKVREKFMDSNGSTSLCVENLLTRPFFRLGGRTYLLTQTSQGSRLEVIIIDLEEPENVVRIPSAESSGVVWSWSPLATDGHKRPWVRGVRRLSRTNWPLETRRVRRAEGSLEWLAKPSRCRRLFLTVSTSRVLFGKFF